jgi:hypothetical protein
MIRRDGSEKEKRLYLQWNNMTQRQFIIGLLEEERKHVLAEREVEIVP